MSKIQKRLAKVRPRLHCHFMESKSQISLNYYKLTPFLMLGSGNFDEFPS